MKLDNKIKNHVYMTKTSNGICTHKEADEIFKKDNTAKIYELKSHDAAMSHLSTMKGNRTSPSAVYEACGYTKVFYKMNDNRNGKTHYYFGNKVGNKYDLNNFSHEKMRLDTIKKASSKEYRIYVAHNGKRIHLDDATYDAKRKVYSQMKGIPKIKLKPSTQKEYQSMVKMNNKQLYALYLKSKMEVDSSFFLLNRNGNRKIYTDINEVVKDVDNLVYKEDFTVQGFKSYDSLNEHLAVLNNITSTNNLYVDASVKGDKGGYQLVMTSSGYTNRTNLRFSSRFQYVQVLELVALYTAAKKLASGEFPQDTIIYSDCHVSVSAISDRTINNRLRSNYLKYIRETQDVTAIELIVTAIEALTYFKSNKFDIRLWSQSEYGTNPAHFKVS